MKDGTDTDTNATIREAFGSAAANRIVTVDVERYQHFLDTSGMTEAQKRDFLQALWSIITAFVDLGFGVHPLQEVCGQEVCGQNPQQPDQSATSAFNAVGSIQPEAGDTPKLPNQTNEKEAE